MRKLFLGLLVLASPFAHAQTTPVSGTVVDQKGNPVAFAFVTDSQHPYATYTDPSGSFYLKADPASNLVASALYHGEVKVKIDNPSNMKIVLPLDSASHSAQSAGKEENFFKPDDMHIDHVESINRIGASGTGDGGVHGSRYLYENWVHGYAITPKDSIKQNDVYLFNYDKIGGNLLFTRNRTNALLVEKTEIKGFTLFDENGISSTFQEVPAIDNKRYVQVLSQGAKYKIYRTLTTKFIKASFTSNGFTSSGNTYDEYKDESEYYVVKSAGQPQKFELKSKAIKAAFTDDPDKVKKFLSENEGDIDVNYIKNMGDFLNQ